MKRRNGVAGVSHERRHQGQGEQRPRQRRLHGCPASAIATRQGAAVKSPRRPTVAKKASRLPRLRFCPREGTTSLNPHGREKTYPREGRGCVSI